MDYFDAAEVFVLFDIITEILVTCQLSKSLVFGGGMGCYWVVSGKSVVTKACSCFFDKEDPEKCPCKPVNHSYVVFSTLFIISRASCHITHMLFHRRYALTGCWLWQ